MERETKIFVTFLNFFLKLKKRTPFKKAVQIF
jgi:hypothetical protein